MRAESFRVARVAFAFTVAAALVGCAGRDGLAVDYNIAFASRSATLYIQGPDGKPIAPLGGDHLSIDGEVGLGPDSIQLAPGRHHLGGIHCPPRDEIDADNDGTLSYIVASHGWPISHDFEIGKAYLLRCIDGYPEIVPYEPTR